MTGPNASSMETGLGVEAEVSVHGMTEMVELVSVHDFSIKTFPCPSVSGELFLSSNGAESSISSFLGGPSPQPTTAHAGIRDRYRSFCIHHHHESVDYRDASVSEHNASLPMGSELPSMLGAESFRGGMSIASFKGADRVQADSALLVVTGAQPPSFNQPIAAFFRTDSSHSIGASGHMSTSVGTNHTTDEQGV